MAEFNLLSHLEKLECYFNWQLDSSPFTLGILCQGLKDRLYTGCNWRSQLLNLLGYIHQTQGSSDEALAYLREAEKMTSDLKDEEQDCLLLVTKANLAWVHYHRGELEESQAYAQEVAESSINQAELNGQKGWALLMFERSHQRRAIESFKMALRDNPQKWHYQKGLALALEKGYAKHERTPDIKREIIDNLRAAKEMNGNDVCLEALYLINALDANVLDREEALKETNALVEKLLDSGRIDGLSNVLYLLMQYFRDYDKALDVAERMWEQFQHSIRVKKNLANCLKRKVFSSREHTEERTNLAKRAIALFEELNTEHSIRGKISLASMHAKIGDMDAAEKIYKSLLDNTDLSDADKQLVYLRYGDHLRWERRMATEWIEMYKQAVQIPLVTDDRAICIKNLASVVRYGKHERHEEICDFLLDLLCSDCRDHGKLFLNK